MERKTPAWVGERSAAVALGVLFAVAAAFTGLLSMGQRALFVKYFGQIHPLVVVVLVTVLGVVSLGFLHARGRFEVFDRKRSLKGVAMSAGLATAFAVVVVAADLWFVFPRDINVPPPESFLFYPAIAYVAEMCFHAVPLALALAVVSAMFKQVEDRHVWFCIVVASLFEPVFQLVLSPSGQVFSGADAFVGVHVMAINLSQLYVFRRFDFVSMYALRFIYYLYWHIGWGYLRLHVLF